MKPEASPLSLQLHVHADARNHNRNPSELVEYSLLLILQLPHQTQLSGQM